MPRNVDNKCSTHRRDPEPGHHCATCRRIRTELRIVRRCAVELIKAGYLISVDDGEEITLKDSAKVGEVMGAVFTTDWDFFRVRKEPRGPYCGWIFFVYGNSGFDVVSDYTTNLNAVMRIINAYADTQEET